MKTPAGLARARGGNFLRLSYLQGPATPNGSAHDRMPDGLPGQSRPFGATRPTFEEIVRRLGAPIRGKRCVTRCPAHDDKRPSLSVTEGTDGRVLLHCFAGCDLSAIVAAMDLEIHDLFPCTDALQLEREERRAARRSYRRTPKKVIRATLERELARVAARLEGEKGYVPPFRAVHINEARARTARILGIALAPVAPFAWECAPHDDDPAWPCLYERAHEEQRFLGIGGVEARIAAEDLAAQWLHALARDTR